MKILSCKYRNRRRRYSLRVNLLAAIFRLFDQKGRKSDVEVRAKLARDQMGVLEDIQKSLGGATATGKKKTPTDTEKLEFEGTEKLVSEDIYLA